MKNVLKFFLVVIVIFLFIQRDYIFGAPNLITNFPAKLGCSLRYVSELPIPQVLDDINVYSPAFGLAEVTFDDLSKSVTSTFLWRSKTYFFDPIYGCSSDELKSETVEIASDFTPESKIDTVNYSPSLQKTLSNYAEKDNLDGRNTRAIVVLKDGNVVGEWYGEGYGLSTKFLGWSMSKTYLSLLYAVAVNNKIVDLDEKRLFSIWDGTDKSQISVRHLLTMTSGLYFEEDYSPGKDATKMLFVDKNVFSRPLSSKLQSKPGDHWAYSSGSTNLLSKFLAGKLALKNLTIDEFSKRVNQKVGIDDMVIERDDSGIFVASSFTYMSARSWAKVGSFFIDKNQPKGIKKYLSEAKLLNDSKNDKRFGFHVWLNRDVGTNARRHSLIPAHALIARGNKGQVIIADEKQNTVVVRLGWSTRDYPIGKLSELVNKALP